MTTANQCEAYAAEYQARGTAPDISIQRATALMSISQSWTTLAGQLDRWRKYSKTRMRKAASISQTEGPPGIIGNGVGNTRWARSALRRQPRIPGFGNKSLKFK